MCRKVKFINISACIYLLLFYKNIPIIFIGLNKKIYANIYKQSYFLQ